jgi:hypothetical protein
MGRAQSTHGRDEKHIHNVIKLEGRRPPGIPTCIGNRIGRMDWKYLVQHWNQWWPVVNMVMNLCVT